MKLNEFLVLRIIDQRNISLRFFAKNKSIRFRDLDIFYQKFYNFTHINWWFLVNYLHFIFIG